MKNLAMEALFVIIIYPVLYLISIKFDKKVEKLEDEGKLDGIKALLVVVGVSYTLILASPLIGLVNTLLAGGAFFAALYPMVMGEIRRFRRRQEENSKFWRELEEERRRGE